MTGPRFGSSSKAETLWLSCGVCSSEVAAAARSLGERQNLATDFYEAHQVCRTRGPWPGEKTSADLSEAATQVR